MLKKGLNSDGPDGEWVASIPVIVQEVTRTEPSWNGLTIRNVKRWYVHYLLKKNRKRFRKAYKLSNDPNIVKFEASVWQRLIYVVLHKDTWKVHSNITVSYNIIRVAATECQKSAEFANIDKIQVLKFSAKWVFNFLKRQNFSRRKMTSKDKAAFPCDDVINAHMSKGQELFKQVQDEKNIELQLSDVFNWDETAWTTTMSVEFCFAPKGIKRVKAIPGGRDRDRITCIPLMNGIGELFPLFTVVKDSSKTNRDKGKDTDTDRNQLNMMVLEQWHKDGFTERGKYEYSYINCYKVLLIFLFY